MRRLSCALSPSRPTENANGATVNLAGSDLVHGATSLSTNKSHHAKYRAGQQQRPQPWHFAGFESLSELCYLPIFV